MSTFVNSVKRAFAQPAFVAAAALLGVFGVVLNSIPLKWTKIPVPLAVSSLREGIPLQIGHWTMISTDHAIDPEIEEVLGTSQYVFRDYVDDRKISPADLDQLKNIAAPNRDALLAKLQAANPTAILRVGITYYTGSVDTVAHVPERCYVADGFDVTDHQTKHMTAGHYADGSPRSLDYSYLSFEDQTGLGQRVQRVSRNVGYVFHCDGEYASTSSEVRWKLQNLFEPYGYYAKIEMMTQGRDTFAGNRDSSPEAMEDFMTDALPALEKCLADWKSLPLHQKKK